MKIIIKAFALSFMLLASFSMLQAQQTSRKDMTPETRAIRQAERMKQDLGLTDQQFEKVKAINLKYAQQAEANFKAQKAEREKRQEARKATMTKQQEEIGSVLTKEQSEKWTELRKERMAKKGEGHGQFKKGGNQGQHKGDFKKGRKGSFNEDQKIKTPVPNKVDE